MIVIPGKRIPRSITLRHFKRTDKMDVQIGRPFHRYWKERTYKPTPASLARVKRLVGYTLGPNGFWHEGNKVVVAMYWRYI